MTGAALALDVQDGIAIITIDMPNEPVNKFSAQVIAEFDAMLTTVEGNSAVRAAVLISGVFELLGAGMYCTRLVAGADHDNEASQRVLEKLGFLCVERGGDPWRYRLDLPS